MFKGTLRRILDSRRIYYSRLYYRLIDGPRFLQGNTLGRRREINKAPLLGNYLFLDFSYIVLLVELFIYLQAENSNTNIRLYRNTTQVYRNYYIVKLRAPYYINELVLIRYELSSVYLRLPQVDFVSLLQFLIIRTNKRIIGQEINIINKTPDLDFLFQLNQFLDQRAVKE